MLQYLRDWMPWIAAAALFVTAAAVAVMYIFGSTPHGSFVYTIF